MSEINKTTASPLAEHQRRGEPERRKDVRRTGHDRREMFRFDLTKDDRRSGKERRGNAKDSWGTDDPI